jgi:tripartite-type tricarboxylate transporter receptor subunit TctC
MDKRRMTPILRFIFVLLALLIVESAVAQTTYPEKPIRIVVGLPPSSQPDTIARLLGQKFTEAWGKPVLIDNITGAAGNIAADRVAKAAPDGYTLGVLSQTQIVVNPSLYKLAYDSVKDFAPVSQVTVSSNILVVHNAVPVKSVKDLVALAKAQPGAFTFASGGSGSGTHLAGELLKSVASVDIRHVPYKEIGRASCRERVCLQV